MNTKQLRGQVSYHAGLSAEQRIARVYQDRGFQVAATRWRGAGGEIDLIVTGADGVVFVEVKQSGNFARAAERLGQQQMRRIYASASEFLATQPDGQMTQSRFDVALVNRTGAFEIIENAFGFG
ncbi:YraN family protein [Arenibacterium sp. CAU 1754]